MFPARPRAQALPANRHGTGPFPGLPEAAAAECLLFLVAFEPFLGEFGLRWKPAMALPVACLLPLLSMPALRAGRAEGRIRWVASALAGGVAINWAAAAYSDGNWPIDRKAAGYLAVWSLYAFHMLSLYALTWIPRLLSKGAPGLWGHWALAAALGCFLIGDYEYFRLSGNHVGIGYIRLFFARDSIAHMGLPPGFWRVPVLKMAALAGTSGLLLFLGAARRRAL